MEDLCIYFRSLRSEARIDKHLFDLKIAELNTYVNENGLSNEEFKILFKSWIYSKLSVSKWMSLGRCIVPAERVDDPELELALCWLLTNYQIQSVTRIVFLMNWLSGLMDHHLLNINILDQYYDFFFFFIKFERIGSFAVKFVYNLTKPEDVTRWRVLELLSLQNIWRTNKRRSQIQVLLGLFKSYKPECVPESVPALVVHNVFPKPSSIFLARCQRVQEKANAAQILNQRKLQWSVSMTMPFTTVRNKVQSVVPDVEFVNIGSQLYSDSKIKKNFLHFKNPVEILTHCLREELMWPANSASLLANSAGTLVLALAPVHRQAQLAHMLHHMLQTCFLDSNSRAVYQKSVCADLLSRVAQLQATLTQPLSVLTNFCSKYLPFWNGTHYFKEIMALLEWVWFDTYEELYDNILVYIENVFVSATLVERCFILHMLTRMYGHIAFSIGKKKYVFLGSNNTVEAPEILPALSVFIERLNKNTLQVYPDSACAQLCAISVYLDMCRVESSWSVWKVGAWTVFPSLLGAVVLGSPSALSLDWLLRLELEYRTLYQKVKKSIRPGTMDKELKLIEAYKEDFINCLWLDEAIKSCENGVIIEFLSPAARHNIVNAFRNADKTFNIRSHMAFAPYTYMTLNMLDDQLINGVSLLNTVIAPIFPNIANFIEFVAPNTS